MLLGLWPEPVFTVSDVYRETVETGLARGYPDVPAIQEAFDRRVLTIRKPRRSELLSGVGPTDSLVLLLAGEIPSAELLANDHPLIRKAQQREVPVLYTAEFVWQLHCIGRIAGDRCSALLREFVANERYTQDFMNAFVTQRKPNGSD